MRSSPVLVSGASGHLGRRVLQLLVARGTRPIIATTRNPESLATFVAQGVEVRRASFADDGVTLAAAFRGARRALLISTDDLVPGQRLAHQAIAVRALVDAGVEHVVYTSLAAAPTSSISFASDHARTETAIAETALGYTFLRNNLYAEMLFFALPGSLASGKLVDARGRGRVAWVTREDCARVAADALADGTAGRHVYEISGREAFSSDELVMLVADVFDRSVEHSHVSARALVRRLVDQGNPRFLAKIFASMDSAIAKGELGEVTDAVQALTGSAPQALRDFLVTNRTALLAPSKVAQVASRS